MAQVEMEDSNDYLPSSVEPGDLFKYILSGSSEYVYELDGWVVVVHGMFFIKDLLSVRVIVIFVTSSCHISIFVHINV